MQTLLDLIRTRAAQDAGAPAILAPGRRPVSYGRLLGQVEDTVAALNAVGIGREDRVAVALPNGPELAVAFLAVASGATCAPLDPACPARELAATLADLNAAALLVAAGDRPAALDVARARGIPVVELSPGPSAETGIFTVSGQGRPAATRPGLARAADVALALHTSGTSARPTLVPLTHRNITTSARDIRSALELTDRDRCLNVMPLFHIHGLSTIVASMAAGASVVCAPGLSVPAFFEWLEQFGATWYTAAPTLHQVILDHATRHPDLAARSSLRFIRSASAAMPRRLQEDLERVFRVPLIEAYGMTEAGPQIASNRLPPHARKPGSVGRPAGPNVAVVDDEGHRLPPGGIGEIAIRGANVITDGWFRTGDTGFVDADGDLFITGRIREIVNRGGEKISPHEVDRVLMDHEAVAEAVTFAVPHPTLGESVATAVVLRQGACLTAAAIRTFAASCLAGSKVPDRVVFLEEIPKGPTGKPVRSDLAERLGLVGQPSGTGTEPGDRSTPTEERVAMILGDVLGVERLGPRQNFFLAGGHSLTAAQAIARLRREFQIDLSGDSLFDRPTAAELGELVAARFCEPHAQHIARRSPAAPCPLSFAQQRLWFLDRLEPGNPAYNMQLALHLLGPLDLAALERSLSEIRRRHETLRTSFRVVDEQPHQVVAPARPLRLPLVDLSAMAPAERQHEARRLASEEAATPLHLAHGPLFRALAVRLDAREHVLVLTMHHIVSDGWSMEVLRRELESLYPAFSAGRASPLEELPIQYADFAIWQRRYLHDTGALDRQMAYWREQLGDLPPALELPADRPRPARQTHEGATVESEIPRPVTDALKAVGRQEGATLFMATLAAFETLLLRYTGQEDFVVGTPIANRTRVETEGLIGFFANTLALRGDLSGDPSFRALLGRVRASTTAAHAHQDLPFERLVEELGPARDASHAPLIRVMFAFQSVPRVRGTNQSARQPAADLMVRRFTVDRTTAKFDLTLYVSDDETGLRLSWQYNTTLFEASTIARMAAHYRTLLEAIVADPDRRLSALPLMSADERRALVDGRAGTEAPAPERRRFDRLFEEQAERTPDAVAVRCGEASLTYRALNDRASRLARDLRGLGVGPETRVGVCLPRSAHMPIALVGILKAGGAFVPLDPDYPIRRLELMLSDAQVSVLVTESRLRDRLPPHGATIVCVDGGQPVADAGDEQPGRSATPASLAYVVYTSGSVGRPKGVMITHSNLCHYVRAMQAALGLAAGDRYLHTASFAFSSSVRQFMLPLSCGAAVIVASTAQLRDPRALFDVIQREKVSVLDVVPSYWRSCVRMLAALEPGPRAALLDNHLRMILSASEALSSDIPDQWSLDFQHPARLINMYGQTETTGIATVQPISARGGARPDTVPIGRPIPHARAYVLDASRQPVPIGVPGELFIGGPTVGLGYLNQPGLTAERFVADPFSDAPGARLYRTGDLARYLPDGTLAYRGRVDHQVKIRGFRVEPEEVEATLNAHPRVRESAVVARSDEPDRTRLVAYVVPADGPEPASDPAPRSPLTETLRERLKATLPDYMVPAAIIELPALPVTPNGKIDRRALAAREIKLQQPRFAAEPGTRAERMLASIWTRLLHVDSVRADDNFFDLGGDSILSVQMIDRANRAGLHLSVEQVFQHQTIAELAAVASRPEPGRSQEPPGPTARTRTGPATPGAGKPAGSSVRRVTLESVRAYGGEALVRAGLLPHDAQLMTDVQVEASLRGQVTHNVGAIPRYARRLASGAMNPRPDIRIERETTTSALVDGDDGPGQLVAVRAMEIAIRKARESGVAVVGARRSNHFGAAGHYAWLAARAGLIGLCTTNSALWLAPTGGITPLFGTNPIGVGVTAARHHPLVLDVSMSVTAKGKVALHLSEGRPLLPGWILDHRGRPSVDPADLSAGLGVPIGGHKGYGLALVMELLAGVLTGAGFGLDHRRELMKVGARPVDFGHFFMAIDPERFMPLAEFTARVDGLIDQVKAARRADDVHEILVPGEAEMAARARNLREGLPLDASTCRALHKYRAEAGLSTQLVFIGEVGQ